MRGIGLNLAGGGAAAQPQPGQPAGALARLQAAHDTASAQFDQTQAAVKMLEIVKAEMGKLSALGDMVTPEDVIEGAGTLVAKGAPAAQMAALLTSMPQSGGPALQAWLAQQEAMVAQREAQLIPAHRVLGHRMVQSALGLIAGAGGGAANALGIPSATPSPSPQGGGEAPEQPSIQPGASTLNIDQG